MRPPLFRQKLPVGVPVDFTSLEQHFPFLAWPRKTVHSARFDFLRPCPPDEDYPAEIDFNFCQIFKTEILNPERPVEYLMQHLATIEHYLRFGVRGSMTHHEHGATWTGGLLWWMEQGVRPNPGLAIFKRRGLTYRPEEWNEDVEEEDKNVRFFPRSPGFWLSDVGLIPQ